MDANNSSRTIRRAAQVVLPCAAIVVGNLAGIGWISFAGMIALGWVVASALIRVPESDVHPPLRRIGWALAAPIVIGLSLIALVIYQPASYVLVPALIVGVVIVYVAIGYLVWQLVRLNSA